MGRKECLWRGGGGGACEGCCVCEGGCEKERRSTSYCVTLTFVLLFNFISSNLYFISLLMHYMQYFSD